MQRNKNIVPRSLTAILLLVAIAAAPACVAVLAAGGAMGYVQYDANDHSREFDGALDDLFELSKEVLVEQGYLVKQGDSTDATVRILTGEELSLRVEAFEGDKIVVVVSIGTFDSAEHRRKAQSILDEIESRHGGE